MAKYLIVKKPSQDLCYQLQIEGWWAWHDIGAPQNALSRAVDEWRVLRRVGKKSGTLVMGKGDSQSFTVTGETFK